MAIAGLRGTGDFGTDERPKNFRETILFFNAKGTAPIFALMARAQKKTVDDPEFSWWNESMNIVRLQAAAEAGTGVSTITVDSVDPTASTLGDVYGSALNLKPGDVLQVEKAEAETYDNEHLLVTSVESATSFTVQRGFAGTTPATIADDAFLTLIGSAYAEGTGAPEAVSRNPVKFTNLTQIFKDTYELTGTTDETRFRTGQPWSNDKKRKTFDHSRAIEMAMLFGNKSEGTGSNGKPIRTMDGLRKFIPASNTTILTSALTISGYIDWVSNLFNFDTGAGDERIVFAGNAALNSLNQLVQADSNSEINYDGVFNVYGMNMTRFTVPQGSVYIKTHPLLNQHGLYSRSMLALDFDAVRYVSLKNRDTKVKDDVQTKDEDLRRGLYQTECSVMVDYGGLTCGYLGNVNHV